MFPKPPSELLEVSLHAKIIAAPEVEAWARDTFLNFDSPLYNDDHQHLAYADILFVWSSWCFSRSGQRVVGTAQRGHQQGALGKKELLESFYAGLNGGRLPDFIITLCAPYVVEADHPAVCALVEHEMYHCGQERDEHGFRKYKQSGLPSFTMRGHDLEEFIGVARRYGPVTPALAEMKAVLDKRPEISVIQSRNAVCGCGAKV